ncbi:MAG: RNA-binding protein [Bacteroidota bacterium]|nr:RNA-binding protein [Bacteroidota bacterium]MDX5428624.1 RNA-binding protein [Bacteroidota bacterium]MDX5448579.1 RNA-binding protein [Bacteroidota bacterium]MDX5506365.1 RNA-binding protein [Bacteroidota bacterium]
MNLYVGNLPYTCSEEDLRALFGAYGEVASCRLIIDRETQRSKGFGFVEMAEEADGKEALSSLDGYSFQGRPLRVSEAQPRESRPRGGGGGFNRGGGGNFRGGRNY